MVIQMERRPSALGEWLTSLSARRHRNVTVVALANKMARIAWAHPEQRHKIRCTCIRGGLNRGLEKTPSVRAWKSLRDFTLFQPSDDEVFLSRLRDKIDV
jgi:hypothetical protein